MTTPDREAQALDWVRRIADPTFNAWDAHMLWLEEDPRNADAFDRVSLDMEAATAGLPAAGPVPPAATVANDNAVPDRRRWRWGGAAGGLVAASVAALLLWPHQSPGGGIRTIATPAGISREIALADGTRVAMNGGTRLRIDADRSIALLGGEAYFKVAHREDRPFRLQAGSSVIQDVGTAFDVAILPDATRVSVREGAVAIDPESANVQLTAGQMVRIRGDGTVVRAAMPENRDAGGWRDGRLVYQGASWTEVATDLSRAMGSQVSITPEMAARPFTGVIMIDRDRSLTIRRAASAAGLSASREGTGWRLAPR